MLPEVAESAYTGQISNEEFANEVRSERLNLIWKATLFLVIVALWCFFLFRVGDAQTIFIPGAIVIIGCLHARYLLKKQRLTEATWSYALAAMIALGFLLITDTKTIRELMPFLSLVPVYVVGLMLPVRAMPPLIAINSVILIVAPWIGDGAIKVPNESTFLALFIGLVSALLSAQASGELYGIAEWALESYRRERDGAIRLFENRKQLERSLLRQRALTDELSKTNEELVEARRAAEEAKHFRGQFLANMSHELRTPLNAVIGFSETMLNFPPMYNMVDLPQEYRADLVQIHNSGKHLLNIINDILDLSKIDVGRLDIDLQRVELDPIFKGVMSTAVGLVGGKPIKLQRNCPDVLPDVLGDPVRIRQVLLNLYSNAAKFTDKGSITLGLTCDSNEVTISVKDTGVGIKPENYEIIFEEFRQGTEGRRQARAGSGLGLAISRQLLKLMNGHIWVESTPGEGSTFYFTLPLYREELTKTESALLMEPKVEGEPA